ncbi:MAG: AbrB/MazE/SpoVT family DNA-binding domain-containing protein [Verrucomicrobiota bacterium]|jgi:AbrB family looped-hinge helix DNA binding protein
MSVTTMSTKGQIVVPKGIRDRAGIDPGDKIEISLEGQIVQLRKLGQPERRPLKITFDKATGLPHFAVPKDAPPITDEWVKQQLSDFP